MVGGHRDRNRTRRGQRVYQGLTALAAVGALMLLGAPAASAKKHHWHSCTDLIQDINVKQLTGLPNHLEVSKYTQPTDEGKGPEYDCSFVDKDAPYFDGPEQIGLVSVLYRSSKQGFANAKQGLEQSGSPLGPSLAYTSVKTIHISGARKAFVQKDDWWDYYGVSAGEYPNFPQYVYEIWALSKNNNQLTLFFWNQNLSQEESIAQSILARNHKWL